MEALCPMECADRVTRLEERHKNVIEKLEKVTEILEDTNKNIDLMRLESAENKGAKKATIALITAIASAGAWLITTAADALGLHLHH